MRNEEKRGHEPEYRETEREVYRRRKRATNLAIAIALIAFVVVVYIVALVRMSAQ